MNSTRTISATSPVAFVDEGRCAYGRSDDGTWYLTLTDAMDSAQLVIALIARVPDTAVEWGEEPTHRFPGATNEVTYYWREVA